MSTRIEVVAHARAHLAERFPRWSGWVMIPRELLQDLADLAEGHLTEEEADAVWLEEQRRRLEEISA